ncbi:hypothetical protein M1N11_05495, partial [Peptococcaceae bacterium]|nr:hypothetical protein [Peptococcaceae bacterium]
MSEGKGEIIEVWSAKDQKSENGSWRQSNMTQLTLFAQDGGKMLNLREASKWASKYLNQRVT